MVASTALGENSWRPLSPKPAAPVSEKSREMAEVLFWGAIDVRLKQGIMAPFVDDCP